MPTSLTAFGKSIKVLLTSGVALGCPREGVLDSADFFSSGFGSGSYIAGSPLWRELGGAHCCGNCWGFGPLMMNSCKAASAAVESR
jgi:hypothetical protein